MPTSTATSQFRASDGDDFDPLLADQGVAVSISIITQNHPGRDSDIVITTVPLLPLRRISIAAGVDHPQLFQSQCGRHHIDQRLLLLGNFETGSIVSPDEASTV